MEDFKIDLMSGRKLVRSITVAAQSQVHAVVKAIPKPLKPGKEPGKPWIRVRSAGGGKASAYQIAD